MKLNELAEKLCPECQPRSSDLKSQALPLIPNLVDPSDILPLLALIRLIIGTIKK